MRCTSLILLTLTCCSQSPQLRTLQVDYLQDSQHKTLFLNVKEVAPCQFEVLSQEYLEETDILILDIFDYNVFNN